MEYNLKQERYELGLGLWFSLECIDNTDPHSNLYRVTSNIPILNETQVKAESEYVASQILYINIKKEFNN